MFSHIQNRLRSEIKEIKDEIRRKIVTYLVAAFSVVAGLAWNEAMKELLEYLFPGSKNSVLAKFLYAFFVTFIVVVLSVYVVRLIKKEEIEEAEKKIKGGHP